MVGRRFTLIFDAESTSDLPPFIPRQGESSSIAKPRPLKLHAQQSFGFVGNPLPRDARHRCDEMTGRFGRPTLSTCAPLSHFTFSRLILSQDPVIGL